MFQVAPGDLLVYGRHHGRMDTLDLEQRDTDQRTEQRMAQVSAANDTRAAIGYCLRVWLAVRIGLTALALAGVAVIPRNEPANTPGWPAPAVEPGWENVATAWERWDALWFLRIADQGYEETDGSAAFFPFYPAVVRVVSTALGGHPLAAALFVSNAAFLAALILFYLLTRYEFDEPTARRSVLYLALFPTSFFFFAPYSESLFLLLALGCLYAARRRQWGWAAVCGALASATRSIGLVLVVAVAIEAIRHASRATGVAERVRRSLWPLTAAALVSLGTFVYLGYWQLRAGDWLVPVQKQGGWLREVSVPLQTLSEATGQAFRYIGQYPGGYHLYDWLIVVVVLVAAVWVATRAPASYSTYTWLSLVIPLSFVFGGRALMSVTRFAITVFPLFWAFSWFAARFRAHDLLVAGFALGLGAFTLLFINWYWIF